MTERKLLETYTIEADKVPAEVHIWNDPKESVPIYDIRLPEVGPGTQALLNTLVRDLAMTAPLEVEEVTDPHKVKIVKQKLFEQTKIALGNRLPKLPESKLNVLSGMLLHRMYGLGFIEVLMADDFLEELAVNGVRYPISVYHKNHGWCLTTKTLESEEEIYNFSAQIGRKVSREITSLHPIMDAYLLTGDRVASTLFPISTAGHTITIRRFARNPWTPVTLIAPETHTMSKEIAAFLWQAIHYELNILVVGGTASGKTSMLNSICTFIPPTQRIISIEDTREITLPRALEWNWVPLTSRNANPEGQGEVSMLDLMVASLRMRPDRIIVGEVRRREQAETLFEAMHTGHSVYATMHADTVQQAKRRLTEPPIEIPRAELEALQLIVVQYRDRIKGARRTLEVAEILSSGEKDLEMNYLFRWRPRSDHFEKSNESIRVLEDLNLHTGMTPREVNEDLKQREAILQWMLDHNIKDIHEVGAVMRIFYKTPDILHDAVSKKKKPNTILQE